MQAMNEIEQVRRRYARREDADTGSRYCPLDPAVHLAVQEKERALIRLFTDCGLLPVGERRVLEIGCGTGSSLLHLLLLGFRPERLSGIELLEARAAVARQRLPAATQILTGDAAERKIEDGSFDIVYQSTVFTSLLDAAFQQKLADRMWRLVKPGGGVLWYDFSYNNPANPDVRGVPLRRIRQLFPGGRLYVRRVTLAPPISRRVTRLHPACYGLFNALPWLRTHLLCWIAKSAEEPGHGTT